MMTPRIHCPSFLPIDGICSVKARYGVTALRLSSSQLNFHCHWMSSKPTSLDRQEGQAQLRVEG